MERRVKLLIEQNQDKDRIHILEEVGEEAGVVRITSPHYSNAGAPKVLELSDNSEKIRVVYGLKEASFRGNNGDVVVIKDGPLDSPGGYGKKGFLHVNLFCESEGSEDREAAIKSAEVATHIVGEKLQAFFARHPA